jgi:predicted Fe-S protein YdhL (DUF1289 family)
MKLPSQIGTLSAVVLLMGLLYSPAFAQNFTNIGQTKTTPSHRPRFPRENGGSGPANNLPPRTMDRLREIPRERQERFLQNNERFQNLPPDQQARIRERLEAWNKLTPGQQQEFRERQRVWEQMTPDQRREVQQKLLPRWQQVPPQRRQAIMQRLHQLRELSESERQTKLKDPAFVEGLNAEDREMLGQLAHLHVGMATD